MKIEKNKVEYIVNTFIKVLREELNNNNWIKLEGFGSFYPRVKKSYRNIDLNTGKIKIVPDSIYIDFKPSKKIRKDKD